VTPDEIITAADLGAELEYEPTEAAADATRLTSARDGAIAICAGELQRPLLVRDEILEACPEYLRWRSRQGTGLRLRQVDVRSVSKVERPVSTPGGAGDPVTLTAGELGTLTAAEEEAVQWLVEPVADWREHTVTVKIGLADASELWPLIRRAVIVVAGAHLDGQGIEAARMAASRVLDGARVKL